MLNKTFISISLMVLSTSSCLLLLTLSDNLFCHRVFQFSLCSTKLKFFRMMWILPWLLLTSWTQISSCSIQRHHLVTTVTWLTNWMTICTQLRYCVENFYFSSAFKLMFEYSIEFLKFWAGVLFYPLVWVSLADTIPSTWCSHSGAAAEMGRGTVCCGSQWWIGY